MSQVTFLLRNGSSRTLNIEAGTTVMQAAVDARIPGIVGECGGSAMCATCHVYIETLPPGGLPSVSSTEDGMLDATAAERLPNSRLGCQLNVTAAMDGLVLRIPSRQM